MWVVLRMQEPTAHPSAWGGWRHTGTWKHPKHSQGKTMEIKDMLRTVFCMESGSTGLQDICHPRMAQEGEMWLMGSRRRAEAGPNLLQITTVDGRCSVFFPSRKENNFFFHPLPAKTQEFSRFEGLGWLGPFGRAIFHLLLLSAGFSFKNRARCSKRKH